MGGEIQFDWDQANIAHIAAHGITPEEAEQALLSDPALIGVEVRNEEVRRTFLGEANATKIILVITTSRRGLVRVVTAWKANRRWRGIWNETKKLPESI